MSWTHNLSSWQEDARLESLSGNSVWGPLAPEQITRPFVTWRRSCRQFGEPHRDTEKGRYLKYILGALGLLEKKI